MYVIYNKVREEILQRRFKRKIYMGDSLTNMNDDFR